MDAARHDRFERTQLGVSRMGGLPHLILVAHNYGDTEQLTRRCPCCATLACRIHMALSEPCLNMISSASCQVILHHITTSVSCCAVPVQIQNRASALDLTLNNELASNLTITHVSCVCLSSTTSISKVICLSPPIFLKKANELTHFTKHPYLNPYLNALTLTPQP